VDELCIVTTGGTIDKIYFDDKSDFQVGEPQIGRILQELGVAFRFNVIPILRKDSLHLTDDDRELIRDTIAAQASRHVLVTHGSDSMVATAKVLSRLGCRVQYRYRGRRRAMPGRRCLHRHERADLGSGKGAQERQRQPVRTDQLRML